MPPRPHVLVTVAEYPGLPPTTHLTLESSFEDVPGLARGASTSQVRCKTVSEEHLEALFAALDPGVGDTVVLARSTTPRELLRSLPLLRRGGCTLRVRPAPGTDAAELVIAAASLGVPVSLDPAGDWSAEALLEIQEYLLHSPALATGVAPLVELIHSVGGDEEASLWEVEGARLGHHYFVDPEGRISLSRRWAEAGAWFGKVGDPPETLRASEAWRRVEALPERIFSELRPCATCRHHRFCRGFLTPPAADLPACAPWVQCWDAAADTLNAGASAAVGG